LCDDNNYSNKPVGTAFAISNIYLLTAYHCLRENDNENSIYPYYTIANSVKKHFEDNILDNQHDVQVYECNEKFDWAVLKVSNHSTALSNYLAISNILPNKGSKIHSLACPIGMYSDLILLEPIVIEHNFYNQLNSKLRYSGGSFSGTSGGAIVMQSGRAIGMHLECLNEAKTVKEVQDSKKKNNEEVTQIIETNSSKKAKTVKSTAKVVASERYLNKKVSDDELAHLRDSIEVVEISSDSNAHSHHSMGEALRLSSCISLVECLERIGIIIENN